MSNGMKENPLEALYAFFEEGTKETVVFDLEWNQNGYAPNLRMPHEIIEIGACRLNERGEVTDRFSELIRPRLYRRVDKHIRQVTGITEQELSSGRTFPEVFADFARFCGDSAQLITWGRDDYPVLRRNLEYYMQPSPFLPPLDAQLVFGFAHFGDAHRQMNLHAALEETGTQLEVPAHRAVYDAECTAALLPAVSAGLEGLGEEERNELSAILEREKRIADSVLRSRPTHYSVHTDALRDDAVTNLLCPLCGRKMSFAVAWFDAGRDRYEAIGRCEQHGQAHGQMHLKRGTNGYLTMHQRVFLASDDEVKAVSEAYRLFLLTPPAKRHHRLCMEEVRRVSERQNFPSKKG